MRSLQWKFGAAQWSFQDRRSTAGAVAGRDDHLDACQACRSTDAIQQGRLARGTGESEAFAKRPCTTKHGDARTRHDGPATKEEEWIQCRRPAKRVAECDEDCSRREASDADGHGCPQSRRAVLAQVERREIGEVLTSQRQCVVIRSGRVKIQWRATRRGDAPRDRGDVRGRPT